MTDELRGGSGCGPVQPKLLIQTCKVPNVSRRERDHHGFLWTEHRDVCDQFAHQEALDSRWVSQTHASSGYVPIFVFLGGGESMLCIVRTIERICAIN